MVRYYITRDKDPGKQLVTGPLDGVPPASVHIVSLKYGGREDEYSLQSYTMCGGEGGE